jgi:hypothetical protein
MLSGIPWSRKAACGLAIVAVSYLIAAFANASPVTQPSFAGVNFRASSVVAAPAPGVEGGAGRGAVKAENREDRGGEFERIAHATLQAI